MKFTPFLFSVLLLVLTLPVASAWGSSYRSRPDGIECDTSVGTLRLTVYDPSIIRVTCAPEKNIPELPSLAVTAKPETSGWKASETEDKIVLDTAKVRAEVDKKSGVVSFYHGDQLVCRESPDGRRFTPVTINREKTLTVEQHFTVGSDEAFYGLGHDQLGSFNRGGRMIPIQQGNTDKTIPVLVSSRGYGILWDNPSHGQADLTQTRPDAANRDEIIPASAFRTADGETSGLTGEYYKGQKFQEKVFSRKDARIEFDWSEKAPGSLPHDGYSVRWTGQLVPDVTGDYRIVTNADDGVRLWIDGKQIIDDWKSAALRKNNASVKLEAGKSYSIKLEFLQDLYDSVVQLSWIKPTDPREKTIPVKPVDISLQAEVAQGIDYYFLAGPTADDVIAGYRRLTGAAPLFGKWVYGYWQCKERYTSAAELLAIAEGFRSRNIPIDNIIQDWRYWTPHPWGSHEFDSQRYPDPAGLVKTLHEKFNLHFMISVWPKFMKGGKNYEEMDQKGFLFPEYIWFEGQMQRYYDPFNPEARKLFWKFVNERLFTLGVDGWWLDGDEPEITLPIQQVDGKDYGHPSVFHTFKTALGSGAKVLNAYPLVHSQAFYEGLRAATDQKRVFLLSRCSYSGMQRYAAACWSGDIPRDWDSLKKQIPAGLDFVMCGVPYWNTDIGGFWGGVDNGNPKSPAYAELFTRWIEYGTFCPMMRVHGEHPNKEPWRFGEETQKNIVRYINLRYRLLPYIYSNAWKITSEHYTLMRPLVMDFGSDPAVADIGDQFMFGPAIMVNPVTEKGATARNVYLPKNSAWIDFWTGDTVAGGRTVAAEAPLDKLPLLIRAGSILPLGPFVQYSSEKPADPIELRIYPGADGRFTLYDDEGDNYNYEKGKYATIELTWDDQARTLSIGDRKGEFEGMLKQLAFKIILVKPGHGVGIGETASPDKTITYDGKALKVSF